MMVRVRMDNGMCFDWFDMDQGLSQGCNVAPLLFNLSFAAMIMVPADELAKRRRGDGGHGEHQERGKGKGRGHNGGGCGAAVMHAVS